MTIHKHFCPNCLCRMEYAGAHCGKEDCKSAAYVTALKASGETSVESFEDGRDPIAGPKVADYYFLSAEPKEFRYLRSPWKMEDGIDYTFKGPVVGRLYPDVDQSRQRPAAETKYGVWFVNDPTYVGRTYCWCVLNEGRGPTFGTLAQAQTAIAQYRNRYPKAEYQIRVYINEHTPGNLYVEPPRSPDIFFGNQDPMPGYKLTWKRGDVILTLKGDVLNAKCTCGHHTAHVLSTHTTPGTHVTLEQVCRCGAEWIWSGVVPFFEDPSKPEKLSDWTRVNFRDIPSVGRVCDYVREVPERNLTFKVYYYEGRRLPWTSIAKYADDDWQWLKRDFKTIEEAKAFCDQKALEA